MQKDNLIWVLVYFSRLVKKATFLILVYLLINSSFAFTQINKKADKEIKKVFSIDNYQMERAINQNFEDFLSKRLTINNFKQSKDRLCLLGDSPKPNKIF